MDYGQSSAGGQSTLPGSNQSITSGQAGMPVQSANSVSLGTGDVVLRAEKKSSAKKWWIAGAVVGILAIAAVALFVAIRKPNERTSAIEESTLFFNKYANYLLYGQENGSSVGDFNPSDTFWIDENDTNESYLDKLAELYEDFYTSVTDDELTNLVDLPLDETKERISLLQRLEPFRFIDEETLFSRYETEGADGAYQYVDEFYPETNDDNHLIRVLKEYDVARSKAKVEFWVSSEVPAELGESESAINEIVYGTPKVLKDLCYEIHLSLKGSENES